jgi:hypothetical protein
MLGMALGQSVPALGLGGVVATAGSMAFLARDAVKKTPPTTSTPAIDATSRDVTSEVTEREAGRSIGHDAAREQVASVEAHQALTEHLVRGLDDALRATGHDPVGQTHATGRPVVQPPSSAEPKIGNGDVSSSAQPSLADGLAQGLSATWSTSPDLGPSEPVIDLTQSHEVPETPEPGPVVDDPGRGL